MKRQRVFSHQPGFVSILNFDKTSPEVLINEPASIEAMNRLGIRKSELSSRTQQSFVRVGCDDTVTQYFYKKWNDNREKLIQQIISKREEIIKEKHDAPKSSVDARRELIKIDIDKKRIKQIDQSGEEILRHMFIRKIREMQKNAFAEAAYNKSIEKANEIQKKKTEQLVFARSAANNFVFKPREVKTARTISVSPSDESVELRRKALNEEIAKERRKRSIEREQQISSARKRSQEIYERRINSARESIRKDDQRYESWKSSRNTVVTRSISLFKPYEEIAQTVKQREDERRNLFIERMKLNETRTKANKERIAEEAREKYRVISMNEQEKMSRVSRAREIIEKQQLEKSETLMRESKNLQQQAEKLRSRDMLKVAERIVDRDEKIAQAKRRKLAHDYEELIMKTPIREDEKMSLDAKQERQRVTALRESVKHKAAQRKELLATELRRLKSLDDKKTLDNIQHILSVSDDEFQRMISSSTSEA